MNVVSEKKNRTISLTDMILVNTGYMHWGSLIFWSKTTLIYTISLEVKATKNTTPIRQYMNAFLHLFLSDSKPYKSYFPYHVIDWVYSYVLGIVSHLIGWLFNKIRRGGKGRHYKFSTCIFINLHTYFFLTGRKCSLKYKFRYFAVRNTRKKINYIAQAFSITFMV